MMEHTDSSRDDMVGHGKGPRHSILDLAPLELECMSALWPMGEGTVRDIHRELSVSRKRAYTTVLTIMDRLSQKGIVTRHKAGRAYLYRANLSADEARMKAVEKIVAGFFAGSAVALAAHLATRSDVSNLFSLPPVPDEDVRVSRVEELQHRGLDETLL
jgi:BlaI family transcriptional regulator, penicillinase repressor